MFSFVCLGEHLPIGEYEVDGAASFVKDYNIDPLIRENFQNMFLDRYHHLKQDKKGNQLNSRFVCVCFSFMLVQKQLFLWSSAPQYHRTNLKRFDQYSNNYGELEVSQDDWQGKVTFNILLFYSNDMHEWQELLSELFIFFVCLQTFVMVFEAPTYM